MLVWEKIVTRMTKKKDDVLVGMEFTNKNFENNHRVEMFVNDTNNYACGFNEDYCTRISILETVEDSDTYGTIILSESQTVELYNTLKDILTLKSIIK